MEMACECGNKATNFHSKCCMVHMEGVITEKGELQVVCEACGKYVGTIVNKEKLNYITGNIESIISGWDNRDSRSDFEDFTEIYQILCTIIGKDPKNLEELYKDKNNCGDK